MRIFLLFLVFVFSLTATRDLNAQAIADIKIQGNERLTTEAILQYLSTAPGQEFVRTQIRDDLRTLYNTGLFKDVRIDVEQVPQGLILIVVVEEKDYIQALEFRGLAEISKSDLEKALNLKPPFLWDDVLVRQSIDSIRKFYRDKGFYLVTVRPEIVVEGTRKRLIFEIDEGQRVVVQKIYFQGNKALSSQLLKDSIFTQEGSFWRGLSRRGFFDEDLIIQIDTRRVQLEYMKRGYAFVQVESPSITFTPDRANVLISFRVEEGERFNVAEISFSGDLDFIDADELKKIFQTQKGRVWNFLKIQEDVQKIQDLYGDQGYAYVNVNPVWTISAQDPLALDIDFRIDKGSLVHFGSIDVIGNFETLDRVIRRELEFSEGELFNVSRYRKSQRNLEKLGYFSNVKFIQKDLLAEGKMDVLIEVEERQTGSFNFGATFSSFDRFGVQGSLSKVNLFGRGYDVSASAMFSSARQIFSAYFRNPRVNDSQYSLTVQAFNTEVQSIDATKIQERGGSLSVGRPIAENWRVAGTYGLKKVDINIKDIIGTYFPDSLGLNSSLSFSVTRDTLNTRQVFFPTSGSYNEFSTGLSSKFFGSDLSYWTLNYTGKKYLQPFDSDLPFFGSSVLSFGLRADYIRGIEGRSMPFNERFVPGGIYSIRGHLFRSLGPSVYALFGPSGSGAGVELSRAAAEKVRLGGNKQLIFNLEYLFDIFREAGIKGVLFFDMGNTFVERDFKLWNTRESAGFGFRWFSPLGVIRFEWGIPIDRRNDEDSILFDFSIGAPF